MSNEYIQTAVNNLEARISEGKLTPQSLTKYYQSFKTRVELAGAPQNGIDTKFAIENLDNLTAMETVLRNHGVDPGNIPVQRCGNCNQPTAELTGGVCPNCHDLD